MWCSELEALLAGIAPEAASVEELCTLLNGFMRGREETRERGDYLDEEEDEEDGGGERERARARARALSSLNTHTPWQVVVKGFLRRSSISPGRCST